MQANQKQKETELEDSYTKGTNHFSSWTAKKEASLFCVVAETGELPASAVSIIKSTASPRNWKFEIVPDQS